MNIYRQMRRKAPQVLYKRLQKSAEAELRQNKELWGILSEYRSKSNSTGCVFTDYLELYRTIRRLKPKEVLECGTGISTGVISYALLENERDFGIKGRLTSMEELPAYHEEAKKLLPASLRSYVELIASPTVEACYGLFRGMRYRDVPERPYEFIFIDGPNPRAKDGSTTFDFDFIHILERSACPLSAIIDRRVSTCFVLNAILGEDKFRYDYLRELGFVEPCISTDLKPMGKIVDRIIRSHPYRRKWFFS